MSSNLDALRIETAERLGWNHVHYDRNLSESTGQNCFRGQPPGCRDHYDNVPELCEMIQNNLQNENDPNRTR